MLAIATSPKGIPQIERVQVIVAGAGPVGAVAALRLAQAGIDVLLLEAGATCALDLRASTFHPPTLQMMQELGLLESLIEQGLKAPLYQYRNRRTGRVIGFDLGELGDVTAYPYRLQCEQWKLAQLASGIVSRHPNGRTLMGRAVVGFEQDSAGVTVFAEAPLAIERYRADYLIACDGANSIIRKWLGIGFDGFTFPEKFLCLSTEWPIEQHFENLAYVNYMADPDEWMVLLRTPSVWRVLVPAGESDDDRALTSDRKKDAVFDRLIGDGRRVTTEHRTIYRVHQRVAQSYCAGRVLLAGDAAHLNNPLGGFGMNSGIHDVWNLTDKLARILNGGESEALLDAYDRQRRTVMHEFVQAQSIRNKQALEGKMAEDDREGELAAIHRDPERRREYLLTQAMIRSRQREAEIA
jgi:3-(3-hydroxy-phenyl)propionate hydroxylase